MTGFGHTHTGIGTSIAIYYGFYNYVTSQNMWISIISAFVFIMGATAPDWLEMRKKDGGTRIAHRTITHWVPLWCLLVYFGFQLKSNTGFDIELFKNELVLEGVYSLIIAFGLGGLLHLLTDLPNPMGVPLLTWKHRVSLKLWKSGKMEPFLISLSYVCSLLWIGMDIGFIVLNFEAINL